jgi:VIT1/CCC1 family predicted Fe2+/Mn2+ transporter
MTGEHPLTAEELMEFLDGELQAAQAADIQAHVATCERCRRLSAEFRGISRDLQRWEIGEAPTTLTAPAMQSERAGRVPLSMWFRWRPVLMLSVAGVFVFVVLTAGTYNMINPKPVAVSAPTVAGGPMSPPYVAGREAGGSVPALPMDGATLAEVAPIRGAQASPVEQAPSKVPDGPSIAMTARLRLKTVDFDKARAGVERAVTEIGGWFRQLDASGSQGQARALRATVMAPAARLDDVLAAIKALGTLIDESKQAEDVSDQIVDVQARLSNARNTERRLVDLLRQRTGKLSEVLEAEQQIGRVREEIERLDAQQQHLQRRVTYAALSLEVREELPPRIDLGPKPVSSMFNEAFQSGLTQGLTSLLGFALFVVGFLPMLLVWSVVLAWPVFLLVRDYRRRRRAGTQTEE